MKRLVRSGKYVLLETKGNTKLIALEKIGTYAWVNALRIGEILIKARNRFKIESILSKGRYRLYDIKNEPKLTDLQHLELEVGDGAWQGYLLPNGIPVSSEKKHRIIPTSELVPVRSGKNSVYEELLENMEVLQDHTIKIS
jgi:hypothetical protein